MKTKIIILLSILSLTTAIGQVKNNEILSRDKNGQPKLIKFKETKISNEIPSINLFLKSQFKASDKTEFKLKEQSTTDHLGIESKKLQQFFNGIEVEFGILNATSKDGQLISTSGNYIKIKSLSTTPKLTEQQALEYVLNFVNAQKYAWENPDREEVLKQLKKDPKATYYPKGKLVIIEKDMYSENPFPVLAYKFDIFALNPMSRSNFYVDASNGVIIFTDATLKHVEGIGATRYSGQRTIETQQSSGQFRLRDNTKGNGIITYNNDNQISHTNTDYTDNDNNWSAAEFNNTNGDNAGLDAHWGAMMTYEYFFNKHNRNSINNSGYSLINYVNANLTGWGFANSDNAFWDGSVMTYGMGTNFNPLVSIDIIAHEIGHGLDQFTSDLVYQRESGAIDEGLSDIWGAMVEFYAAPEKSTYTLGEDIGFTFRSMSDPKSRNQPDTYRGVNWRPATVGEGCATPTGGQNGNDYCGVHTNSGILNHWFYLLAEGSSTTDGVNDNGDNFNIVGIGKDKAARVIYRAQTVYFTSTTDYEDARLYTIQAAEDLYGHFSVEASEVCQSWFAVGVGNNDCFDNVRINGNPSVCYSGSTIYTLEGLSLNINVSWSVSSNLQILSSNNSSITVKAVNSSVSGSASITASFQNTSTNKSVWVGKPSTIGSLSHVYTFGCTKGEITVFSNGGAEQYEWRIYGGTIVIPNTGTNTYIGIEETIFVDPFDDNYTFTVKVRAKNSCGYSAWYSKNIPIQCDPNGGGGETPLFNTFINGEVPKNVTIFPNPTSDYVYVYLPSKSKYLVQIIDINGRTLIEKSISDNLTKLDISSLPNNVYFIKVTGKENSVKKLIIQH